MPAASISDRPVIERIRVHVIGFGSDRYSWSALMPAMVNTDTIVRITLSDGSEGVGAVCSCVEHGVDRAVAEGIRPLIPGLIGRELADLGPADLGPSDLDKTDPNLAEIDRIWDWMSWRRPYVGNPSIAAIDIALWDLAAKRANRPLWAHLGGSRNTMPAYASIPVLEDHDANIALIEGLTADGFGLFKFHYKCVAEADIGLIEAIDAAFGDSGLTFMFDAECAYDLEAAKRVAAAAEAAGFLWLEAPMPDRNLADYAALKAATSLPILPAGITIADEQDIVNALAHNGWSAVRCDTASSGGLTPMRRIADLAAAHEMNFELQSWGSSLSTAANFHLSLATPHSRYFEVPVPRQDFDLPGVSPIAVNASGTATAAEAPGLGLEIDWTELEAASEMVLDVRG